MELELSLLGPPHVHVPDNPELNFPTLKSQALLIYLCVEGCRTPERPIAKEQLIDMLWPGMPSMSALQNLRQTLYQIRKVLEVEKEVKTQWIESDRKYLRMDPAVQVTTDIDAFFSPAAQAKVLSLAQTETLVQSREEPFLENFYIPGCSAFDEWVDEIRSYIADQRLYGLEYLAVHYQQEGQERRSLSYSNQLIALDPFSEAFQRLHLKNLHLSGLRNQAIIAYQTYEKLLTESLGVQPTEGMRVLYEEIQHAISHEDTHLPILKQTGNSIWQKGIQWALLLGVFLVGGLYMSGSFDAPINAKTPLRMAVLPFQNQTTEEYLADGLTDELIISLSKVAGIQMISRQSSNQFRNMEAQAALITEKLQVAYFIEGSIVGEGDEYKVRIQLVEAPTGEVVWADQFMQSKDYVFTFPQTITNEVTKALSQEYDLVPMIAEGGKTYLSQNAGAYQEYLKGRFSFYQAAPEKLDEAVQYFHQALELDPDFYIARAWLAWTYCSQAGSWGDKAAAEVYPLVMEELEQLEGQKDLAAIRYKILGWMHLWLLDKGGAVKYLRQSIQADPQEEFGQAGLSLVLSLQKDYKEARQVALQSLDVNPHFFWNYFVLAHASYYQGDWEQALKDIEKGLQLFPNHEASIGIKARSMFFLGRFEEAIAFIEQEQARINNNSSTFLANLGLLYANHGDVKQAESYAKELHRRHREGEKNTAYLAAKIYSELKEYSLALELLDTACKQRDNELNWLQVDREFDPIRNSPEFQAITKQLAIDRPAFPSEPTQK